MANQYVQILSLLFCPKLLKLLIIDHDLFIIRVFQPKYTWWIKESFSPFGAAVESVVAILVIIVPVANAVAEFSKNCLLDDFCMILLEILILFLF